MSRLDVVVRLHNEISESIMALDRKYENNEIHREIYENERVRFRYALEDLREILRKSLLRSKYPVTLVRRLKNSYLKNELMQEID